MNTLDNKKKIASLDTHNMYHKIINMPEQIYKAYHQADIFIPKEFNAAKCKIKRIIFCGMGGSAISGDIAASMLKNNYSCEVVKDYNLPYVSKKTLVILCSYSGNTAETVSLARQAVKKSAYIAGITSGGQLKQILGEKFPVVAPPLGFPPRSAIAYLFFSILKILETYQLVDNQAETVKRIIGALSAKAAAICIDATQEKNIAKSAAVAIMNKIPIIYAVNPTMAALAYRWKCQINENAKYPAFCHSFPEMNHNEIEGWETLHFEKQFIPIFLTDFQEKKMYSERHLAFKQLMAEKNIACLEFYCEGETLIEKYFSLIYLGDIVSYYLGILAEVDPTSIKFIDYLKEKIS